MKNISEVSGIKFRGVVTLQLWDKNGKIKKLFQGNSLWTFFHKLFGLDLRIPLITGFWTKKSVSYNTITNGGLALAVQSLGKITGDGISHMGIGEGTPTGTALGSEITTGGGERSAVTGSSQTTTITDDTVRFSNLFSFTDAFAVTEEGLFNASSDGVMVASKPMSVVNASAGDSLLMTHDIIASAS